MQKHSVKPLPTNPSRSAAQRAAKPNRTGLPDALKSGVEALSGLSLDHVRVHRNSAKPAQLNAHAYAQGSDIHLAPGQEKHLPHEAWHVVQQARGRVKPTMQLQGNVPVNDDAGLEHEADLMGSKALQRRNHPGETPPAVNPRQSSVQRMTKRLGRALTNAEKSAATTAAIQNSQRLSAHGRALHGKQVNTPPGVQGQQAARSRRVAIDHAIQLKTTAELGLAKPAPVPSKGVAQRVNFDLADNSAANKARMAQFRHVVDDIHAVFDAAKIAYHLQGSMAQAMHGAGLLELPGDADVLVPYPKPASRVAVASGKFNLHTDGMLVVKVTHVATGVVVDLVEKEDFCMSQTVGTQIEGINVLSVYETLRSLLLRPGKRTKDQIAFMSLLVQKSAELSATEKSALADQARAPSWDALHDAMFAKYKAAVLGKE
jgi:hypothetical protein